MISGRDGSTVSCVRRATRCGKPARCAGQCRSPPTARICNSRRGRPRSSRAPAGTHGSTRANSRTRRRVFRLPSSGRRWGRQDGRRRRWRRQPAQRKARAGRMEFRVGSDSGIPGNTSRRRHSRRRRNQTGAGTDSEIPDPRRSPKRAQRRGPRRALRRDKPRSADRHSTRHPRSGRPAAGSMRHGRAAVGRAVRRAVVNEGEGIGKFPATASQANFESFFPLARSPIQRGAGPFFMGSACGEVYIIFVIRSSVQEARPRPRFKQPQ